jgi:hypothetical protein
MTAAGNAIRFDESDTWWALALVVFLGVSTGYVCEQAAVAQLTFDSDNRSTGLRLAAGGQWLICWIGLLTFLMVRRPQPMHSGALTTLLTLTATYITLGGLLFASAPDSLSRRVSRGLPRSRAVRLLWAPFLPGGARGLLYALISLVVLGYLVTVVFPEFTLSTILNDRQATQYSIALAAYSVLYLGAGAMLARLLRRVVQGMRSYQVLAILALANILLVVGAEVIHFVSRVRAAQLYDVVNPVITLQAIADADAGAVDAVACLVAAAGVALLANASALWCGVRDVVNDPVRAEIEGLSHAVGIVE